MAEEKNPEQNAEPTAEERAQFEQDVLKAAQDAMNLEAEANGSANKSADDAPKADDAADAAKAEENAEEPAPTESAEEVLKAELAAANDRTLRLMAEFDNFRRRSAKEQLDLIETANGKLLEKLSEVQDNFERAFAAENKAKDLEAFEKGTQSPFGRCHLRSADIILRYPFRIGARHFESAGRCRRFIAIAAAIHPLPRPHANGAPGAWSKSPSFR